MTVSVLKPRVYIRRRLADELPVWLIGGRDENWEGEETKNYERQTGDLTSTLLKALVLLLLKHSFIMI